MPTFLQSSDWSQAVSLLLFVGAAVVIGVAGWKLTATADRLADRTGMGEALMGAVFLGASTSLSGSVLSIVAALEGRAELAMGNALGGIPAQMAFLAVADMVYRRANLEHAAASAANLMQGAFLVTMLGILLLAAYSPEVTIWKVHPATPLLVAGYVYGLSLVRSARTEPMWRPEETGETRHEESQPDQGEERSLAGLWFRFAILALIAGGAGFILERAAVRITQVTGLSETVVGVLFTSVSTSLPELITTIAAVRRGALTLAIGGIIGGNAYDTLFAAFSDVAYRSGSIYHAMSGRLLFFLALSSLMTGVLLMGMIRREPRGIGKIGFESILILVLYALGVALLFARSGGS